MRTQIFIGCIVAIFILLGCKKDQGLQCLGCGIDTSPELREFTIKGTLINNCIDYNGIPAQLEFFSLDTFSTEQIIITEQDGQFEIKYTDLVPYLPSGAPLHWASDGYLLKIEEDSTIFRIPGMTNFSDLNLIRNDSINIDVYVEITDEDLSPGDTIIYWFAPFFHLFEVPSYKFGGPLTSDSLINQIYDRWRIVEIDELGNPFHQVYWKLKRSDGTTISSSRYQSLTSKKQCINRIDTVVMSHY